MLTVYEPGLSAVARKYPESSAAADCSALVPLLRIETCALGITAPFASNTVPLIAPSVVDWAVSSVPNISTDNTASSVRRRDLRANMILPPQFFEARWAGEWETRCTIINFKMGNATKEIAILHNREEF